MVTANSEPSAQLAGSQTTAFFSFCSSLGSDVTEVFPVWVQQLISCLHVKWPGVTRGACSTWLQSQNGHEPLPLVPLSLAPLSQHSFSHVLPWLHWAMTWASTVTVRWERGAKGVMDTQWDTLGGCIEEWGLMDTYRTCWQQLSGAPLWEVRNHTVPGCHMLARQHSRRSPKMVQKAPMVSGGMTWVAEVALRWGDAPGRGRVGAHTPSEYKCLCWMAPCHGTLGFRPTIITNASLV